jgi:hypothetical protein
MALAVDVPDVASLVGEISRPDDGIGVPRPEATLQLRRLGDAGGDQIVHPADEALVVGGIQKQGWSHPDRNVKASSVTITVGWPAARGSYGSRH